MKERRRILRIAVLSALVLLSGCGADPSADTGPTATPSTSSPSPTTTTTPEPSTTPGSSDCPTGESIAKSAGNTTLSVDTVHLTPGSTGNVTVRAENVTSLHIQTGTGQVSYVYDAPYEIDPQPDLVNPSFWPTWHWDERSTVTATLPIHASRDLSPGTYCGSFISVKNESMASSERGLRVPIVVVVEEE